MPGPQRDPVGRPDRWRPGAQLVALVVIVAVALGVVVSREPAQPVTRDAAVERFREAGSSGGQGKDRAVTDPSTPQPTAGSSGPDAPSPTPQSNPTPAGSPAPVPAPTPPPTEPSAHPGTPVATPAPSASTAEPAASSRPEAGVYTYDTEGYDRIDAAGGRRHDYPDRTTITVRHSDCGFDTRWDVLEERWDEAVLCRQDDELTVHRLVTYREFVGYGERKELSCELRALPAGARPGQRWTGRCSGDDTEVAARLTVVGREDLTIAGETVEAIHVRTQASFSGDTRGSQTSDRWFHPDTGLELRGTSTTDVTSGSPFGDVQYEERFERQVTSLEPVR